MSAIMHMLLYGRDFAGVGTLEISKPKLFNKLSTQKTPVYCKYCYLNHIVTTDVKLLIDNLCLVLN